MLTIIAKWMPYIKSMANKYNNRVASFEDLCSVGVLAIIKNMSKYNKNRGNLDVFLYTCIRNDIYGAAIQGYYPVSVPHGSFNILKNKKDMRAGSRKLDEIQCESRIDFIIDIMDIIEKYDRHNIAYSYFFDNETYGQKVARTGWSIATISRHINKIRDRVKKYLEK